jgi:poly(A) polymerase
VDPATAAAAREHAAGLERVSPERIFAELKRVVVCDAALEGLRLMDELGATPLVLPELEALRGVEQNPYHHRDVYGHTLEVLAATIDLERDPAATLGAELADGVRALLDEPLGDGLTRAGGLRFAALLHDAAKPRTRVELPGGRIGFPGHDVEGAAMARDALARLRASERLRAHVAALTRHHLRLGFLVHEEPLDRRAVYRYLRDTAPVSADVTLLSVADRLATRGRKADEAIARHVDLARRMLAAALDDRAAGAREPLVRGDQLARALGIAPGPRLGELLEAIAEARFAGEVRTGEEAVTLARALLEAAEPPAGDPG